MQNIFSQNFNGFSLPEWKFTNSIIAIITLYMPKRAHTHTRSKNMWFRMLSNKFNSSRFSSMPNTRSCLESRRVKKLFTKFRSGRKSTSNTEYSERSTSLQPKQLKIHDMVLTNQYSPDLVRSSYWLFPNFNKWRVLLIRD